MSKVTCIDASGSASQHLTIGAEYDLVISDNVGDGFYTLAGVQGVWGSHRFAPLLAWDDADAAAAMADGWRLYDSKKYGLKIRKLYDRDTDGYRAHPPVEKFKTDAAAQAYVMSQIVQDCCSDIYVKAASILARAHGIAVSF